jgi:hypothetical protein
VNAFKLEAYFGLLLCMGGGWDAIMCKPVGVTLQ